MFKLFHKNIVGVGGYILRLYRTVSLYFLRVNTKHFFLNRVSMCRTSTYISKHTALVLMNIFRFAVWTGASASRLGVHHQWRNVCVDRAFHRIRVRNRSEPQKNNDFRNHSYNHQLRHCWTGSGHADRKVWIHNAFLWFLFFVYYVY